MTAPRRVLVVITRRIGDVLLATPLIRSLKRAWPQAQIDVLVFAGTEEVISANPDIQSVITIAERPDLWTHLKLVAHLLRRYDLAFSCLPGDRPTLYAWLAGKKRVGLLEADAKNRWKQRLLNQWTSFDNLNTHTVLMHLKLAELLNISKHYEVLVSWSDTTAAYIDALFLSSQAPNQRLAVLHLYPKFNYKMWHAQGWSELSRWLAKQGLRIVLTGSAAPEELDYIEKILPLLPQDTLNLAGRLNLEQSSCLLSRAAIYVGPDTVVTHIAAALSVPTVALYGPTNPVKWGPWPKGHNKDSNPWKRLGSQRVGNVMLVQGTEPCVPCLLEGCDRHIASFSDCLQELKTDKVIAAAESLLKQYAAAVA
ncbi:MAG TPA: glycosyltransferase family 9 protein [Burkholderiales bacterium]|nr:glycosyltransferase family 9 protein [Burkholderiales bacterium]